MKPSQCEGYGNVFVTIFNYEFVRCSNDQFLDKNLCPSLAALNDHFILWVRNLGTAYLGSFMG